MSDNNISDMTLHSAIRTCVRDELLRDLLLEFAGISPIFSLYNATERYAKIEAALCRRNCITQKKRYETDEDTTVCKLILTTSDGTKIELRRKVICVKFKSARCECYVDVYSQDIDKYLATRNLSDHNVYLALVKDSEYFTVAIRSCLITKEGIEGQSLTGPLSGDYLGFC